MLLDHLNVGPLDCVAQFHPVSAWLNTYSSSFPPILPDDLTPDALIGPLTVKQWRGRPAKKRRETGVRGRQRNADDWPMDEKDNMVGDEAVAEAEMNPVLQVEVRSASNIHRVA